MSRARACLTMAFLFAGCSGEELETRADPALLLADSLESDTIVTSLIARQRALFLLLSGKKREGLTDYVTSGYSWRFTTHRYRMSADGQLIEPESDTAGEVHRLPAIGYRELARGKTPEGLRPIPDGYKGQVQGKRAVIIAFSFYSGRRFETYWRLTGDGWRAANTFESLAPSEATETTRSN